MDLKLKSLKTQLEMCNDKLSVIDYVYYMYDKYLDDDIKQYVSLRHTLLELNINNLINEIDEVYKELEESILERIDIIQQDIDRLKREEEETESMVRTLMYYLMMSFYSKNPGLFMNRNKQPESLSNSIDLQAEIDKLDAEFGVAKI